MKATTMKSGFPKLINEYAAAELLGLSVHTMRADRYTRKRLPFLKLGRAIRYDLDTLRDFLDAKAQGGNQ